MTHQEQQKEHSKQWLAAAFFDLLQWKAYESISISDIARKASLSRRTFYRVFRSKEDIIFYHMEQIFPDYIAALKALSQKKREHLAVALVGFVNRHLDFFRCLRKNRLDHLIIDFFDEHLAQGRAEVWPKPFSENPEIERVFMMTISVEHYNIIRLWLDHYEEKTPEELSALVSDALSLFRHFND